MDCLFCKIVNGEIPSTKVYENERVLAFRDISPQAPTHILVIPKQHIASMADISPENSGILSAIGEAIADIAKQENLDAGFRVISNVGKGAGQTVFHLHFHIIGGKTLSEKMV